MLSSEKSLQESHRATASRSSGVWNWIVSFPWLPVDFFPPSIATLRGVYAIYARITRANDASFYKHDRGGSGYVGEESDMIALQWYSEQSKLHSHPRERIKERWRKKNKRSGSSEAKECGCWGENKEIEADDGERG